MVPNPEPTQLDTARLIDEMAQEYGRLWAALVQMRVGARQQAERIAVLEAAVREAQAPAVDVES